MKAAAPCAARIGRGTLNNPLSSGEDPLQVGTEEGCNEVILAGEIIEHSCNRHIRGRSNLLESCSRIALLREQVACGTQHARAPDLFLGGTLHNKARVYGLLDSARLDGSDETHRAARCYVTLVRVKHITATTWQPELNDAALSGAEADHVGVFVRR